MKILIINNRNCLTFREDRFIKTLNIDIARLNYAPKFCFWFGLVSDMKTYSFFAPGRLEQQLYNLCFEFTFI